MEKLTLTSAQTQPSVTGYTVERLNITRSPACIDWTVVDNTGKTTSGSYTGAEGAALLGTLNRGNFSVNSLQKQMLNKLKNDGYLPTGTVSGTPD